MSKRIIEICANSVESCLKAQKGGAARVELCAGIPEGGTTPSYGEILAAKKRLDIALHVIVRPRGGDFCYSEIEIEAMLADIELCKRCGVDGIVVGVLLPDGRLDIPTLERLMKEAKPQLSVTFHRAFDACIEPEEALEQIIALGCDRILTSGQRATAELGANNIRKWIDRADNRIIIMPGCGVNAKNIALLEETGAKEFHLSARHTIESPMTFRRPELAMGDRGLSEFELSETSYKLVEQVVYRDVD